MYSFSYLEPVWCSMSSSNCCFLTCIQISQEAGQVVWYSHLFQKFPQFIVIHTVKGFGVVNKAEIDVFLELSCFFNDPEDIGNLISGSSAFSKTSLNIWKFSVHVLLKPGWKLSHWLISVFLPWFQESYFKLLTPFLFTSPSDIRDISWQPEWVFFFFLWIRYTQIQDTQTCSNVSGRNYL